MAVVLDPSGGLRQLPYSSAVSQFGGGVVQGGSRGLYRQSEQTLFADAGEPPMVVTLDVLYSSQPVVAAVVNKLARTFASIPLKVYRLDPDSGDRVRVREDSNDVGSDLARLLCYPAARRSATSFKQWMVLDALVFGNSLIAKYQPDPSKPPIGLLPLDWRFVSAWAYQGEQVDTWETTQLGKSNYLKADRVLHFAWNAPGRVVGVSPLEQLARTLLLEDAARRYQVANFQNASRMGGYVTIPAGTRYDPAEVSTLRENLEGTHRGPDQAGKLGILPAGANWYSATFSAVEAELMGARQFNRVEVCIAYDVKPPIIGDMEQSNYSSLIELNRDFQKTTMRPWYTMAEETIKAQLIDPEPSWAAANLFVEFDMSEVLRGDPVAEAQAIDTQIQSAQLTPNEGRRLRNMAPDPSPAADLLYLPVNNLQPIGSLPQRVRAPAEDPSQVLAAPASLPDIADAQGTEAPPSE